MINLVRGEEGGLVSYRVPLTVDSFLREEFQSDPLLWLDDGSLSLPGDSWRGLSSKPDVVPADHHHSFIYVIIITKPTTLT